MSIPLIQLPLSTREMTSVTGNLVCAAFNALCFFVMYRIFSAQVEMLETKMREWRKEMKELKRDINRQLSVAHYGVGVSAEGLECIAAVERRGTMRDGWGRDHM